MQLHFSSDSWHLLASILVIIVGAALLRRKRVPAGTTPSVLLLALLLPMGSSLFYESGISLFQRDITPGVFLLSGVMTVWSLSRWKRLDPPTLALSQAAHGMQDALVVTDTMNRIVDFNAAAVKILKHSPGLAAGAPVDRLYSIWPSLPQLLSGTDPRAELVLGADGSLQRFEANVSPVLGERDQPIGRCIVLREITERTRSEAQLLDRQRAVAALTERRRLARELHDGLAQVLGYLHVEAQTVQKLNSDGMTEEVDRQLARLSSVAREALTDVREYVLSTRSITSPLDFFDSLHQQVEQFGRDYGTHAEFHLPEGVSAEDLAPGVQIQLQRIAQEALSNVRKHSQATTVRVDFQVRGEHLQMVIEDDGRGFDVERLPTSATGAFGLASMQDRAEEAGGTLGVRSAPGQGTRVEVLLPMQDKTRGWPRCECCWWMTKDCSWRDSATS